MRTIHALAIFLLSLITGSMAETKRPNILLIFADDWGKHAGAYAKADGPGGMNDVIRTPNFDRVASEGVLFRKAFVSSPSCTPCRSALVSGQHFWRTGRGSILHAATWDDSIPSFPLMLQKSGYHLGKMYKVWSPGIPENAPIGGQTYAYEKAGTRFNQFSQNVTALVAAGKTIDEAKAELLKEVELNFKAFLEARPAKAPFCFWFGPTNTHRKWIAGSGKAFWGLNPDDLKGKLPPFLPDVPEIREDVADYFGEAMALDTAIGLLINKLEAIGELDNTLIVISGDHGAPGFPHGKCNLYDFGAGVPLAVRWGGAKGGRVVDDLISLTDLAPSFLEAAGVTVPEVMTGRSILPILRSDKEGLVDPSRKAVFVGRERHFENARDGWLPYPQRTIRTQDFSLIVNFKPDRWPLGNPHQIDVPDALSFEDIREKTRVTLRDEDAGPTKAWLVFNRENPQWKPYYERAYAKRPRIELYDLKKDPHQINNVAELPEYAAKRSELEQLLIEELTRTGDPRLVDDGRYYESPPMAGPLAIGASGIPATPEELRQIKEQGK